MQDLAGNIGNLLAEDQQPAKPVRRYQAPARAASYGPGAMTRFIGFILRWATMLVSLAALILAVYTLIEMYYFDGWWIFLGILSIVGFILSRSAKSSKPNLGRYNWFMLIYLIISLLSGAILFSM